MAAPPSSTALRVVLWGTTLLVVGLVAFVALVPGPELPPEYGHFHSLHDSLVRGAAPAAADGPELVGRVESGFGGDRRAVTWLYRADDTLISVHRLDGRVPRPRGATDVPRGPRGAFAFERGELLLLVAPEDGGSVVVAGYAPVSVLRDRLNRAVTEGPGADAVPVRTRPGAPRPAAPTAAPPVQ